jgi:hypothetical protein
MRAVTMRVLLVALAVPNLIAGLWAVIAPEDWYDNFPGWSPALVAAHPPYNEHLATDAGAGLLAAGLLAGVAAIWFRREVIVVAMIGYLGFSVPHAVFHLAHPSDALSSGEDAMNSAVVVAAVIGAAAVLLMAIRQRPAAV